jgi:hypothetical protein
VKGTHIVAEGIKRREGRCIQSGGFGCAFIRIQCGSINQIMPVEVDLPGKISWDSQDD